MIGADDGRVEGADAAGEHANAIAAEPADDGPAGAGAEGSRTDAGLAGEEIAQRRCGIEEEFAAGDDRGGLREIGLRACVGRGGNDDVLEGHGFVVRDRGVRERCGEKDKKGGTMKFGHGGAE